MRINVSCTAVCITNTVWIPYRGTAAVVGEPTSGSHASGEVDLLTDDSSTNLGSVAFAGRATAAVDLRMISYQDDRRHHGLPCFQAGTRCCNE